MAGKWRSPGVPHKGWTCTSVEGLGAPDEVCQMCETQGIRHVRHMEHPDYPERLAVGCSRCFSACLASLPHSIQTCAASGRPQESSRRGGGVSVADGLRRSAWKKSGPELPKGSHRPGLRARWGSRAEPSARPRLEGPARPFKVTWKSGKPPSHWSHEHRDLFSVCSLRCPYMQLWSV